MNSDLLHQICDLRSVHCTEKVVCLCQQFTYYYFPTVLSSLWDSGSQSQTTLYKTVQHFSASQMSHKFYKKNNKKQKPVPPDHQWVGDRCESSAAALLCLFFFISQQLKQTQQQRQPMKSQLDTITQSKTSRLKETWK